jgi:hypothetical protein
MKMAGRRSLKRSGTSDLFYKSPMYHNEPTYSQEEFTDADFAVLVPDSQPTDSQSQPDPDHRNKDNPKRQRLTLKRSLSFDALDQSSPEQVCLHTEFRLVLCS